MRHVIEFVLFCGGWYLLVMLPAARLLSPRRWKETELEEPAEDDADFE